MEEVWKDIPDYEGLYQISNFGSVKSLNRNLTLKGNKGTTGYIHVNLSKFNKYKTFDIHRLVASMFIPNPEKYKYVNHIDGNKLNNYYKNLEWTTAKENTKHATELGLKNDRGSNSKNAKLKQEDVLEIRKLYEILTKKEISQKYGISASYISLIVNNKRWSYLK